MMLGAHEILYEWARVLIIMVSGFHSVQLHWILAVLRLFRCSISVFFLFITIIVVVAAPPVDEIKIYPDERQAASRMSEWDKTVKSIFVPQEI